MPRNTHAQDRTDAFVKHCRFVHHTLLVLTIGVILVSTRVVPFDPGLAAAEAVRLEKHLEEGLSLAGKIHSAQDQNLEHLYATKAGTCIRLELVGGVPSNWKSTPSTTLDALQNVLAIGDNIISSISDVALKINGDSMLVDTERPQDCILTREISVSGENLKFIPGFPPFPIIGDRSERQTRTIERDTFEILVERRGILPMGAISFRQEVGCSRSKNDCFKNLKDFVENNKDAETLEDAITLAKTIQDENPGELPLPGGLSVPLDAIEKYGVLTIVLLQWFLAFHLLFQYSNIVSPTIPWIGIYDTSGARFVFRISLLFPCLALLGIWDSHPHNYALFFSILASILCLHSVMPLDQYFPPRNE